MTHTGTSPLAGGAIYHVLGVPYRTGSLTPGSEHDAQPYRDTGFVAQLQVAGCEAIDGGDIPLPSYLPHHEVPPIRNWPGPRIAWEILSDRLVPILDQPGHVPLLIGGDCSIVVGTTQALMKSAGLDRVHLLYIDGDCDDGTPDPTKSQSAAYLALWLAMHGQPFRAGPGLPPSQVTIIGATQDRQGGAGSMLHGWSRWQRFAGKERARLHSGYSMCCHLPRRWCSTWMSMHSLTTSCRSPIFPMTTV